LTSLRGPSASALALFRSARGRTGELTELPMHRVDAWRMTDGARATLASTPKSAVTRSARPASQRIWTITALWRMLRRWRRTKARARQNSITGSDEVTLDEIERIAI
jgi:hypothetical protein